MYYKKTRSSQAMVYVPLAQRQTGFHKPTLAVGFCTPRRCLVIMAATLVVTTVFIQCLFSFRHAFSDMHLRTDIDGELVIVSPDIAHKHDATCLDGSSSPGYYFKKGMDDGEQKWLLAIPHSDWCNTLELCQSRKEVPLLGTMKDAPVAHKFSGILSSDPMDNQYFSDWNMVYLVPCDGAAFLGNSSASDINSKGANILSAILDHLLLYTSLPLAEEVVFYGERSGAVSALLYTSTVKRMLPLVSKFTTVLHSGLLLDVSSAYYDFSSLFRLHNIKDNNLLTGCHTSRCLQANIFLDRPPHTPILVYTSAAPKWVLQILYGCEENETDRCSPGGATSKQYLQNLMKLHSTAKPVKHLTIVVTSCELPFLTTPSNGDPIINKLSVYKLLAQSLSRSQSSGVYIEKGNCSSSRAI
ncbi:uncharacterized protein [Watersipora subatra]|uniref:uncharacterized protein isoform X2 n=1 Tax=Watersipora subatra TaxID=2589382 RepID=UPI00355AD656